MLSDADHRLVLAALTTLAAPVAPVDYGPRLLAAVRAVIPCDIAALNDVDPSVGRFVFVVDPVTYDVPDDARDVLAEHAHEHPLVVYTQRTGDGSARRISDVVATEEFHASPLYTRLYGPIGVEHQMSITLALPLPAVVAVTVSRGAPEFTDRERDLLDLLRPHLTAGWGQVTEVARLAGLLEAAGEAEDLRSHAVALTQPVRELTVGALQEFATVFGHPAARTGLPPAVTAWLDGDPATPLTSSGAQLRLVPAGSGRPAVLLLQDRRSEATPGLTSRETELLGLLVEGGTNQELADRLYLAPGTVKKHLDNIYAKLGVRNRVQAVTRALELGLGSNT